MEATASRMSDYIIFILIPLIAFIYASVGHGGASSYLMVLAVLGFAPEEMRPTALLLNIFVSSIAFLTYRKTCEFPKKLFLQLIIFSVPAAYVGGSLSVDALIYRQLLGVILIVPILRFTNLFSNSKGSTVERKLWMPPVMGLIIGFISGLIGIGGGILLAPVLLLLGWTSMKETAAISALFILINSIAGLLGIAAWNITMDSRLWMVVPVVVVAGVGGAYFGANRLSPQWVKNVLILVLALASFKLMVG